MAVVGLVSCVRRKRTCASKARDLYDSPLFNKARAFVERNCDKWFILSAKYGLVPPDQVIEPYEVTLKGRPRADRQAWAAEVWRQLAAHVKPDDHVMVLAGSAYREFLLPMIADHGCRVEVPMEGKPIGRQLQWLSQQLRSDGRV